MSTISLDTPALLAMVRPLATAGYAVDYEWRSLEWGLGSYERDYGLNLLPDFQRGHVWTARQQAHFIENVMRGVIPTASLLIQFNCPHWDDSDYAGELPREMQIIDGLQRLTAVREFMAGRVHPFGLPIEAFAGTPFDPRLRTSYRFRVAIHTFTRRADLLQHYLDINTGGTPHSDDEIERVQGLLMASCQDGGAVEQRTPGPALASAENDH